MNALPSTQGLGLVRHNLRRFVSARGLLLAVCATLSLGLPTLSYSQSAQMSAPSSGQLPSTIEQPVSQAVTLLRRIQEAARHLSYRGVFAFQHGESIESARIAHLFDGQVEKERIEVLDGPPREYLRRNDEVYSLLPEQQTVLREQRRGENFPSLFLADAVAIEKNYEVVVAPELYRVTGRPCRVIEIVPRDTHRYGYKLCADVESNLLLKAQTLSTMGAVLDQVAFTQVAVGEPISEKMLAASWEIASWKTIEIKQQTIDLGALGWRVFSPPGYLPTAQLARVFADKRTVNQFILSDGLANISIFIEPYATERSEYLSPGASRNGSVSIFGIRVANFWVTVLGEVPASTIEQLSQSIQYVPSAGAR